MATPSVDWYFDFVSPYSYIALHRLRELSHPVSYKPVLFAGLLNHWGQKGPAEIPAKRRWTYRWCTWWAKELGVPFRFPAAHPFNPLPHLRLALACGDKPDAVKRIFEWTWMTGYRADDPARFSALCRELGVAEAQLSAVKGQVRANTGEAAARGVFRMAAGDLVHLLRRDEHGAHLGALVGAAHPALDAHVAAAARALSRQDG